MVKKTLDVSHGEVTQKGDKLALSISMRKMRENLKSCWILLRERKVDEIHVTDHGTLAFRMLPPTDEPPRLLKGKFQFK